MTLLGSTGSIGVSTLDVAKRFGIVVRCLVAGNNMKLLMEQIEAFSPKVVAVATKESADELKSCGVKCRVLYSQEGVLEAISETNSDIVVNAIVGFAGLSATLHALKLGKTVALANKESLVAAGRFIDANRIRPIDSEHFGLWYLLGREKPSKMTLTASGGALRDMPLEKIANATLKETLAHPNWSMGRKITVDSATMANKLFELLEARWLFGESVEYDAIIETSSTIHAFVEFAGGVTTAQLSTPDMRLPIAYALLGKLEKPFLPSLDLHSLTKLEFRPIDKKRYRLWELKEMILSKPDLGVVLNAANEVAVERFLQEECDFGAIAKIVQHGIKKFEWAKADSISDIFEIDKSVREFCRSL